MALGTPISRATATQAGNGTTASFTVPAGDIIFASRALRTAVAQPDAHTISDSQSLTWNVLCNTAYRPATVGTRLQVWWAVSNGNAMTVTTNPGAVTANQGRTEIFSISGADTDFSNANTGTDAAGDPSVTLPAAPDAGSTVVGWGMFVGITAVTPPSGFTELDEVAPAQPALEVAYDAAGAPQTIAWTTTATESIGCGRDQGRNQRADACPVTGHE